MKDEPRQFVDTNVLVYAHDASAGFKHQVAQQLVASLWESRSGCLSLQVLQEFYVTVTQKVNKPLPAELATRIISDLGHWTVHLPTVDDVITAIAIQQRYKLSFWDAMIIGSAYALHCEVLWTEDLKDGQSYEGVKVVSPFTT